MRMMRAMLGLSALTLASCAADGPSLPELPVINAEAIGSRPDRTNEPLPPDQQANVIREDRPRTAYLENAGESDARDADQQAALDRTTTRPSPVSLDPIATPSQEPVVLGGVVARVNGRPVYSHDLLTLAAPNLKDKQSMDAEQFARLAEQELFSALRNRVHLEIYLAAAERELAPEDKRSVDLATAQWRDRQIIEAGGSLAEAKRRAAISGVEFDEMVRQTHRLLTWRRYRQTRILPRVQITPREMRQYYDEHQDVFSSSDRLQMRVIVLEAEKLGTLDDAIQRAKEVRQQWQQGSRFEDLAKLENHNELWRNHGGDLGLGMIDRNSFIIEEVEDAAWALPEVGEVTQPIVVGQKVYLAQLTDRERGGTRPFSDPQVQRTIRQSLMEAEQTKVEQARLAELQKQSVIEQDEAMFRQTVQQAVRQFHGASASR